MRPRAKKAAPIARRVFDYLLLGHYPSDEDMALTREGKSSSPVGKPRLARDVPLPGQGVEAAATAAPSAPVRVAASSSTTGGGGSTTGGAGAGSGGCTTGGAGAANSMVMGGICGGTTGSAGVGAWLTQ